MRARVAYAIRVSIHGAISGIREAVLSMHFPMAKSLFPGTYQESCPLGVLELRTSLQLTSI